MTMFKGFLFLTLIIFTSCSPSPNILDSPLPVEAPQKALEIRIPAEPAIPRYQEINLTFLGDIMAHTPNFRMTDYSKIYQGLGSILKEDDLTFANLETVVDPNKPYATYPRFNVHQPYVWAAVEAGIDVLSLANNHTNDHGLESSFRTLDSLEDIKGRLDQELPDRSGLWWSGIRSEVGESKRVTPILYQGWNIGFISFTHFLNDYTGSQGVYLVPFWDQTAQTEFVELVRRSSPHYDLFIVAYHGGDEYVLDPPSGVQGYLDRLYNAGAHIVWGHHPHVIQPWQIQFDEKREKIAGLVMPSMGNLISGQTWRLGPSDFRLMRAYTGDSAILQVRVSRDRMTGKIHLDFPRYRWISTHNTGGETHIRLTKELIRELEGPWENFFHQRYRAMEDLIRDRKYPPLDYVRFFAGRNGLLE